MDLVQEFYRKPSTLSNYPTYQRGGSYRNREEIRNVLRDPKMAKVVLGLFTGISGLANTISSYRNYSDKYIKK